jgi:hypothetical protein
MGEGGRYLDVTDTPEQQPGRQSYDVSDAAAAECYQYRPFRGATADQCLAEALQVRKRLRLLASRKVYGMGRYSAGLQGIVDAGTIEGSYGGVGYQKVLIGRFRPGCGLQARRKLAGNLMTKEVGR